jgi:hypothetical protein
MLGGASPTLADLTLGTLTYRADVWCRARHGDAFLRPGSALDAQLQALRRRESWRETCAAPHAVLEKFARALLGSALEGQSSSRWAELLELKGGWHVADGEWSMEAQHAAEQCKPAMVRRSGAQHKDAEPADVELLDVTGFTGTRANSSALAASTSSMPAGECCVAVEEMAVVGHNSARPPYAHAVALHVCCEHTRKDGCKPCMLSHMQVCSCTADPHGDERARDHA